MTCSSDSFDTDWKESVICVIAIVGSYTFPESYLPEKFSCSSNNKQQ